MSSALPTGNAGAGLTSASRTPSSSELAHLNRTGVKEGTWPYSPRANTPVLHHTPQMGFVGIGSMGYHMARNLADTAEQPVTVWNRTKSKSEALANDKVFQGAKKVVVAETLAEVVNTCDVIFTNLASDEVVISVFNEIVQILKENPPHKNKILVETSTLYPTVAGRLDADITKIQHVHFVSAPVFGAPPAANARQLVVVLAGDHQIKKEVAHLMIPSIGRKIIDMGGNVEKANSLKLIGNALILGQIELLSETMTLADKAGVGAANLYDIIKELFPSSSPIVGYGKKILNDEFDGSTGFSLSGGLKDATHIRKLAAEKNSPVPTIDIAHQHLLTARALAHSPHSPSKAPYEILDWSSLAAATRIAAGLPGFDSSKHGGVQLDFEE